MMMRWLAMAVLTVFLCGTASPEWVRVGGTHKYDGYVDMATIGRTDHNVMLWTLRDFTVTRQVARGPYRSVKTQKQYDCRHNRSRLLFSKYYAEQMGEGRLVYQGKATKQWAKVAPGSDGEAEWKGCLSESVSCSEESAQQPAIDDRLLSECRITRSVRLRLPTA